MARNPHFYPSFGRALYEEMLFNWSVTAREDSSRWQVEVIKTTMARTIEVDNVNAALPSLCIGCHHSSIRSFFLSFIFIPAYPANNTCSFFLYISLQRLHICQYNSPHWNHHEIHIANLLSWHVGCSQEKSQA